MHFPMWFKVCFFLCFVLLLLNLGEWVSKCREIDATQLFLYRSSSCWSHLLKWKLRRDSILPSCMSCMLRRDWNWNDAWGGCSVPCTSAESYFLPKILAARRATHHFCLQALLELVPTKLPSRSKKSRNCWNDYSACGDSSAVLIVAVVFSSVCWSNEFDPEPWYIGAKNIALSREQIHWNSKWLCCSIKKQLHNWSRSNLVFAQCSSKIMRCIFLRGKLYNISPGCDGKTQSANMCKLQAWTSAKAPSCSWNPIEKQWETCNALRCAACNLCYMRNACCKKRFQMSLDNFWGTQHRPLSAKATCARSVLATSQSHEAFHRSELDWNLQPSYAEGFMYKYNPTCLSDGV